jgi:alpha-glucosidase
MPWLPLNADWATRNVALESADPASILSLHRDLLRLRRTYSALAVGEMTTIATEGAVLAYSRYRYAERMVILLNLSPSAASVDLPSDMIVSPLLSTLTGNFPPADELQMRGSVTLRGDEGLILVARPA